MSQEHLKTNSSEDREKIDLESGDRESETNPKRAKIIVTDKAETEEKIDQRINHSPSCSLPSQSETPNLENSEKTPPRFNHHDSSMLSSDSDSDSSESSSDDLIPKWGKYTKRISDYFLSVLKNGLTYQIKILLVMRNMNTETLNISGGCLIRVIYRYVEFFLSF